MFTIRNRFEIDDKLTVLGQSIVTRLLAWRGIVIPTETNPVLYTMTNIFKWSSLALIFGLILVFQGIVIGWL